MSEPEWPDYLGGVSRDYIYAIGVLIANWNNLEEQFVWLLWELIDSPYAAESLTSSLNNSDRFELLKSLAFDKIEEEEDRSLINQLVSYTSICNQNRNIVAHASFSTVDFEKQMIATKRKSGKGTERSHYRFSLDELRQAADQTMEVFQVTKDMRKWLKAKQTKGKNLRTLTTRNQFGVGPNLTIRVHSFEIKRPVLPEKPKTLIPLPPKRRASP